MRRPGIPLLVAMLAAVAPGQNATGQDAQTSRPLGTSEKGLFRIEPTYFDLAASTGGDFYFWGPGEFAAAAPIDIPSGGELIAVDYGRLTPNETRSLDVPVDSTVGELSLFLGAQRKDLVQIVRPDGTKLRPGAPGTRLADFRFMTIATIPAPGPGIWRVEVTGAGRLSFSARGRRSGGGASLIALDGFAFVAPGGRPGHEGYFPVDVPRAGADLHCRVELSGEIRSPVVELVSAEGARIATLELGPSEDTGASLELFGPCRVPNVPFRAVVRGVDGQGHSVRRIEAGLHTFN
jgi:hypothetical protein